MSADNLLCILGTPNSQGYEYRVGVAYISDRPWEWYPEDNRDDAAMLARVTDYRMLFHTFSASAVYQQHSLPSILENSYADGTPPEYGMEIVELDEPWATIADKAKKQKKRRPSRRERLERKRAFEAKAIRWEAHTRRFRLGWRCYTLSEVGAMLAHSMASGQDVLFRYERRFAGCISNDPIVVTREYVRQMLIFIQRQGWFWDGIQIGRNSNRLGADHDFDPAAITPGLHWAECQFLEESACGLERMAARHAESERSELSDHMAAHARRLRESRAWLLATGLTQTH